MQLRASSYIFRRLFHCIFKGHDAKFNNDDLHALVAVQGHSELSRKSMQFEDTSRHVISFFLNRYILKLGENDDASHLKVQSKSEMIENVHVPDASKRSFS